jgi:uncharacterized repeat protein (TIGR04052 family)
MPNFGLRPYTYAMENPVMRNQSWLGLGMTAGVCLTLAACETTPAPVDADMRDAASASDTNSSGDTGNSSGDTGTSEDTGTDAGPDAPLGDAGNDAAVDGGPVMQAFSIRFAAQAGATPVSCGTPITNVGLAGGQTTDLVDFRFYVHNVELLTASGAAVPLAIDNESPWQNNGVALLDFENATGRCTGTTDTRDVVRGMAPAGTYTGIRFVLGVPFAQNHADASTAAAPLNVTALFWNWQGGYKFARIDTSTVVTGETRQAFNIHLGSTSCDGTPAGGVTMCTEPNRPTVELSGFNPATSVIIADFAQLVEGLDLRLNTAMTAPGCMSGTTDPECFEVLPSFGAPIGARPAAQDFFHL